MNLTRNNWESGYIPSDDDVGGRTTGFLRMDNCYLDEHGAVSLTPGTAFVGSFPGAIHSIYSAYFSSTKSRFVGLSNGSVHLVGGMELISGGSTSRAAFSLAFGHVFIGSGTKFVRYDGSTVTNVGLAKPNAPVAVPDEGPFINALLPEDYNNTVLITGSELQTGPNLGGAEILTTASNGVIYVPKTVNTLVFPNSGQGTDMDRFSTAFRCEDVNSLRNVRIEVILAGTFNAPTDYFVKEWSNEVIPSDFNQGFDAWTVLECRRIDFQRAGQNTDLGWGDVIGYRLSVQTRKEIHVLFQRMFFFGSDKGLLEDSYEYAQRNVERNANYIAKSPLSEPSTPVRALNGRITVTPSTPADPNVNEIWIYRRSASFQTNVRPTGEPPKLDRWYRVAVVSSAAPFNDERGDNDVLLEGEITFPSDASMRDINDTIVGITDEFYKRILILTSKELIISEFENPDSYYPHQTIRFSTTQGEQNLWITKIDEGTVFIGTTHDIYIVTGSFEDQPDSSIDINIRSLGLQRPPINSYFAKFGNAVIYMTADGLAQTGINGTTLLVGELDLLFRGKARYGIPPITIAPEAIYALTVYRGQLWAFLPTGASRRGFIYDFTRNYWHVRTLECISLFVERDGTLLGGFSSGDLRILDTGNKIDGITNQSIELLTVFDDNEQPRNRKDTFTFKFTGFSIDPVEIALAKDRGPFVVIHNGPLPQFDEHLFDASSITLGKRYALCIKATTSGFQMQNFTLEYEPRPEQQRYIRIPNTNLGTLSRKRITSYAFGIDTLGNPVTFRPLLDNVPNTTSIVNRDYKSTYIHFFTSPAIATDIGGELISASPFEFYGLNLEETVSEKLPTPVLYLEIPADDYGIPNRKRHSSYKFQINTRGAPVRFTPRLDGVDQAPREYTTNEKLTVEYFFPQDTIAIDIGGKLESLTNTPFEFYGSIKPQDIEVLPPRLTQFRIPENNYGIASPKRIRTMPMVINTNNAPVQFYPIVDHVIGTPSIIVTPKKQTAFHYFLTDSFGTDYSGELISSEPFEFYGLLKPEDVEVLPVPKMLDQVGPWDFPRLAKLLAFRVRVITRAVDLPYTIYVEDVARHSGVINTVINTDRVYSVMQLPKTIAGTVMRIVLGPTAAPFHRYHIELKVNISGSQTDSKWLRLGNDREF